MKRFVVLIAAAALVLLGALVWFALSRGGGAAAFATLVPAGPIACPENPNDLSGIEGWAPGAGRANEMGNGSSGNVGGFAGALGGANPTPAPSASQCTGLSPVLAARFDAIDADAKYVPTEGFDPAARAEKLADIDATFAYVRDYIHTEAYAGSMRGAAGTLQARGGSPADKALLLGALLAAKQIPVRYAHATLADADVASIVAAVLAKPAIEPGPDLSQAFAAMGIDPAAERAGADALQKRTRAQAASTVAGAAAPTDALLSMLQAKNVKLAADDSALRAAWAGNLRDHWWLQVQQSGTWVDYDPTLPGAKSGTHVGGSPAADTPDTIPAALHATMTVRLVAQHLGSTAAVTLVERTLDVADANAAPIVVVIGDRNAGSSGIGAANSFVPTIGAGGSEQTGDPFGLDGLAAVDLEIVVQQPGMLPRLYRRSVVDRRAPGGASLDPGWTPQRTAYALTGAYNVLPLAGNLDPGFTGMREIEGLRTVRAMMAYAAAGGNGKQNPPLAPQTYPMQALHYFEYDQLVRGTIEDDANGVRFFFDRPQIAIEHHGFVLRDGAPRGVAQFDIVENGMAATGTQPAAAIRANFSRGYVDELAEQHLFSAPNDGGTIALLDAARSAGVTIQILQGDRYGGVAIAPEKAVQLDGKPRIGWWQVDAANGNLIGRMGPDGAGQELAEYAMARANDWSTLLSMIEFYGDFFRCIAGSVEAPLEGLSGAAAESWFKQCAGAAICSYLEALGSGEAMTRLEWSDLRALLYNIMDLSVTGSKDSWPPSGGSVCGKFFSSPLSNP